MGNWSREAARRKWASRLQRNSHGEMAGGSVSDRVAQARENYDRARDTEANANRNSMREPLGLISNDSLSRVRGNEKKAKSYVGGDRALVGAGLEGPDVGVGKGNMNTVSSVLSGTAFI